MKLTDKYIWKVCGYNIILLYTLLRMPQWKPAKENGKNIHSSVKFLLHLSPNY